MSVEIACENRPSVTNVSAATSAGRMNKFSICSTADPTISAPTGMLVEGCFGESELHFGKCVAVVDNKRGGDDALLYRCVFSDGLVHDLTRSEMIFANAWYSCNPVKTVMVVLHDQSTPDGQISGVVRVNEQGNFVINYRVDIRESLVSLHDPFTMSVQREIDGAVGMCVRVGWSGDMKPVYHVVFEGGGSEMVDLNRLAGMRERFLVSNQPPIKVAI